MPVLALSIVLAFFAVIAVAFATWWTVRLPTYLAESRRRAEEEAHRPPRQRDVSNDALRGAKAPRKTPPLDAIAPSDSEDGSVRVRPRSRTDTGGDPFDRFLERGNKRDRF